MSFYHTCTLILALYLAYKYLPSLLYWLTEERPAHFLPILPMRKSLSTLPQGFLDKYLDRQPKPIQTVIVKTIKHLTK